MCHAKIAVRLQVCLPGCEHFGFRNLNPEGLPLASRIFNPCKLLTHVYVVFFGLRDSCAFWYNSTFLDNHQRLYGSFSSSAVIFHRVETAEDRGNETNITGPPHDLAPPKFTRLPLMPSPFRFDPLGGLVAGQLATLCIQDRMQFAGPARPMPVPPKAVCAAHDAQAAS